MTAVNDYDVNQPPPPPPPLPYLCDDDAFEWTEQPIKLIYLYWSSLKINRQDFSFWVKIFDPWKEEIIETGRVNL